MKQIGLLLKKLFLNEKFILSVIFVNSFIIYLQATDDSCIILNLLDVTCTIIFLIEMIIKHAILGWKRYWKSGWNRLDGILVILSIPSVLALFIPNGMASLSILLLFRLIRVLRFFRIMHFFPNFSKIVKGFKIAMRESYAILLSFLVLIVIFGLLNYSLFKDADPEHFQTPLHSIYAMFQICTVEGWYEIPNTLAAYYGDSSLVAEFVRAYFCILLLFGGIIGLSFINSVFVDAMVADNNDDIKKQLDEIQNTLNELKKQIK